MAHKLLLKPTFILTLTKQFTTKTPHHHFLHNHHHYPIFNSPNHSSSFLNIHPISLRSTTTTAAAPNYGGYLDLTDDDLMRQCEMGTFKSSGPGGQHRNKRESAVRLKHLPTGIIAQVLFYSIFTFFSIFKISFFMGLLILICNVFRLLKIALST